MSSSNALENGEDLENIPLVRMQDVQPPRDRNCEIFKSSTQEEVLEAFVVDDVEYGGDCVVNDDEDSNIGSMVSIHSEEVSVREYSAMIEDNSVELIVPDILKSEPRGVKSENTELPELKTNRPERWPTLEILPGGVIKRVDKCEDSLKTLYPNIVDPDTVVDSSGMMYACAKCSQSFKYLFCLVKHVKWHEKEKKKEKVPDLAKLKSSRDQKYTSIYLHSGKRKLISKSNKRKSRKS